MSTRFATWLEGLRAVVDAHAPREAPARFRLLMALWAYLARTIERFRRLEERWRAGTLPKPRPPRPPRTQGAPPQPDPQSDSRPRPRLRLPTRRAWVTAVIGHRAALYGPLLHNFVQEPEFAAFLRAAPQAARLVRPLLRMLSIHPLPPILALPPRRRKPRPRRPKPRAAPALLPGDRPLQPYVRAAARAWKPRNG